MDSFQVIADTYIPSQLELGFVVNLETFRSILKGLNLNGRRWWIASDPADAVDRGYITIGHGDEQCVDRLNTVSFRVPVLSKGVPWGGVDRMLLLFDASAIAPDQPGFYMSDGRIDQDEMEDFRCFFSPIKAALIRTMQTGG